MEEKNKLSEKIQKSIANGGPRDEGEYQTQFQWKQEWMTVHIRQISNFLTPLVSYVMKETDGEHIFPVDIIKPCPVLDSPCDRLQVFSYVDPDTGTPEMKFVKNACGNYIPLQYIRSDITKDVYEKMVNFIQLSTYPLFNPDDGSGLWIYVVIRVSVVKEALLEIRINDSSLEPHMKTKLREDLINYFQNENVSTTILTTGDPSSTDVLFGKGYLDETISSFNFTVDSSLFCWYDISGIKKLSHTIINFSKMNKKSWGVLQVGCLAIVPTLFIARCCKSTVIVNVDSKLEEHIITDAEHSDIQNLETSPRCDKEFFEEVLKNKFPGCQHNCAVIFDCNTFLDGESEIEILKTTEQVKKIICVSSFESPMLLRKVVTACQKKSGLENEFVITKLVPVEMSPYEHRPIIIVVLDRKITLEDKIKKNSAYSSVAVNAFLKGDVQEFQDFSTSTHVPDVEESNCAEHISLNNINENEVTVIYENNAQRMSSNNDDVTVIYENSTQRMSSNNDDVTVIYENVDLQKDGGFKVNPDIDPQKQIIEMLQKGGPKSFEEYEMQLKLKEDNLLLEVQIFTHVMKTVLPNLMKERSPGYLFQMDKLRPCSFIETSCDRLLVQTSTVQSSDPISSESKQWKTRLIYGLNCDAPEIPLSITLAEIRSPITRAIYERMQTVMEEFGQPLYNTVKHSGFWKSFQIRVNSFGQSLLEVVVKISGNDEDACAMSSELEPLLKKHFLYNTEQTTYNLETLILDIVHKRGTVNQVVLGEGYLTEVVDDFKLKLYEDFLWSDINGVRNLSEAIVNLVNLDSSWTVVQLGRGYLVPSLYLAKQCGKYFLFCKNQKTCRNIQDVAEENGITNLKCKSLGAAIKNVKQAFSSDLSSSDDICVLMMQDFYAGDDYASINYLKSIPAVKQIAYIPKNINDNMKKITVLCEENPEYPDPFVITDVVSVDISPHDNNIKTIMLLVRKSLVKSLIEKNEELCPKIFDKLLLVLKDKKRKMDKKALVSEIAKLVSEGSRDDYNVVTSKGGENKESYTRPLCSAVVQELWTESRKVTEECQNIYKAMERLYPHKDPKLYVDFAKLFELKKKLLHVRMMSLSKKLNYFLPTLVCNLSPSFLFHLADILRCPTINTMCERTCINLESDISHPEGILQLSRPCRTKSAKLTYERVKSFVNRHIYPLKSKKKVYWKNALIRTNWNGKVWLMVECIVFSKKPDEHMSALVPLLKNYFTEKGAENCNLATLILKIDAMYDSATKVVFGDELMEDVIENFKVKVHGRNMVSSNPYGIKNLCETIVKLAGIDKTWSILQLNSDTGMESLRLAKLCNVLYLSEIPQQSAVNLLVIDNNVKNIIFLPVSMESEFNDVVNNKLKTCENLCVIQHLKNYDCSVPSLLRNNSNIKKIIFVSDINYGYWAPNIVSCCLKQSGIGEPFVIKDIVPVDMSPSDDEMKVACLLIRQSLVKALVKVNPSYSQEKVNEYLNEISFGENNLTADSSEVSYPTDESYRDSKTRDNHMSSVRNERWKRSQKHRLQERSHFDRKPYDRTDYSETQKTSTKRYNPEPARSWDSHREADSQREHQNAKRTRSPSFSQEYDREPTYQKIQKRNVEKDDSQFQSTSRPVFEEFTLRKSTDKLSTGSGIFQNNRAEQSFNRHLSQNILPWEVKTPWVGTQQSSGLVNQITSNSTDLILAQASLQKTLRNEIIEQTSRLNTFDKIPYRDIVEKSTKSDLFGIPLLKEMRSRYDLLDNQATQDIREQTTQKTLFSRESSRETTQQNYGVESFRGITHLSSSREPIRENLSFSKEPSQQSYGRETFRGITHLSSRREPIRENLSFSREPLQQSYGGETFRGITHLSSARESIGENLSAGRELVGETVKQNYGGESFRGISHLNSNREPIREDLSFGRRPMLQSYGDSFRGNTHLDSGMESVRENLSIGREPVRKIAQQSYREEFNSGTLHHNSREELIREIAQQSQKLSLLQEALKRDLSQSSSGSIGQSRPLVETLGINIPQPPATLSTQQSTQDSGLFGNRTRNSASFEENLSQISSLFRRK